MVSSGSDRMFFGYDQEMFRADCSWDSSLGRLYEHNEFTHSVVEISNWTLVVWLD